MAVFKDSLPSDQPSQVQPEPQESAPGPQASEEPKAAPESAEIKPEAPQGTQEAPLADSEAEKTQKSSFGNLVSEVPAPSTPVSTSAQAPPTPTPPPATSSSSFGDLLQKETPEEPAIHIEPVEPPKQTVQPETPAAPPPKTETVIEAKADFSSKRQQALQTRRKKREEHLAKILTLVSQKGKINNKEVCDLLRVSQSTATNYLRSLVKDGKLKKEAKGKATKYLL